MTKRRRSPTRPTGWNFLPPHCPNRECDHYEKGTAWRWRRAGSFARQGSRERFQCYRCLHCGRYFSVRTFAADYWLKRRDLLPRLAAWACEGPGLRQMARRHEISHSTVMRHLARAARLALVFHGELLGKRRIMEALVMDGFESFAYSQYFPFHLNLGVGAKSWFVYGFTDSPLRRKGRMTERQRQRRAELEERLGRPDPKAVENGMAALLRALAPLFGPGPAGAAGAGAAARRAGGTASDGAAIDTAVGHGVPSNGAAVNGDAVNGDAVNGGAVNGTAADGASVPVFTLHSDDHPAYPRAWRRIEAETGLRFAHHITSSRERRTCSNPLFPVNLTDLLLRHGQANHRRETIAFSKRVQAAIERAALLQFWRNYVKKRRENGDTSTAAMEAGWQLRPLRWADLFVRRLFPRREHLPDPWWAYYWRDVKTPALEDREATHRLRYAF